MSHNRATACAVLQKVFSDGHSFHPALIAKYSPGMEKRDQAFVAHLCFGVLRYYFHFEEYLKAFITKPLKPKDNDIKLLIMVGLFQIFYTDTPSYAAIHATVEATKNLNKPWARGLVNGVLRQALRKGNTPLQDAHPKWLIKQLQTAWPNEWEKIIAANLTHPPFVLRVNTHKISRDDYVQQLKALNINATSIEFCPAGIQVDTSVQIEELPGFKEGWVSVQDGAGQLAADLLQLEPNQWVLDACAAPGSKTTLLLETQKLIHLIALEKDPDRFAILNTNLKRLGWDIKTLMVDATLPQTEWSEKQYDRILLDVPCSATGVIRRHPDILHHRQPQDILQLVKQQSLLLEKLWPLLKPNGILVYATCSILPQENGEQIEHFLVKHPDARELPIEAPWGLAQKHGRQILPGQHTMDGFYYARLTKHG